MIKIQLIFQIFQLPKYNAYKRCMTAILQMPRNGKKWRKKSILVEKMFNENNKKNHIKHEAKLELLPVEASL